MRYRGIIPAAFAAMALLASCNDARKPMETVCWFWTDSTAHAYMAIDAELPSFVVPYDDVKPFLTPEARRLLGL